MKLLPQYVIEDYEQLKAIGDPFRAKIVSHLIEKPYTGQQLAQALELPRSKIHYHLNELEKNGLIRVVKTEVKNGIVQKFYRSVARSFVPGDRLLPYRSEVESYLREATLNALNRARLRAISAPEEAFLVETSNREEWPRIALQMEVRLRPETFVAWLARFRQLVNELARMEEEDGMLFYLTTVGFQIDQPEFMEDDGDEPGDSPADDRSSEGGHELP